MANPTVLYATPRLARPLWLDKTLPADTFVRRRAASARYDWEGVIRGRIWSPDFSEADYRLIQVGGNRRHMARPDGWGVLGAPHYILSDGERRERERLLDRYCLDAFESHNAACNAGRTILLNFVAAVGGQVGVTYFAVGTGVSPTSSAPGATDTALWTEYYRQAIGTTTIAGNQLDLSTAFGSSVANTTYTEAGVFGGSSATGTANTGSLYAHASYSYTKTNTVNLTNDYLIYFN